MANDSVIQRRFFFFHLRFGIITCRYPAADKRRKGGVRYTNADTYGEVFPSGGRKINSKICRYCGRTVVGTQENSFGATQSWMFHFLFFFFFATGHKFTNTHTPETHVEVKDQKKEDSLSHKCLGCSL